MASSWERYRKAGAAMRMMLVEAAARDWAVPASEIKTETGRLNHASGKTASYGHFGREDAGFTWESTDRAESLRAAAGLAKLATA